jgi:hydroxymethylglutaryl-CoA lyase
VEIALADTIGVGDPARVMRLVPRVAAATGLPVRVHFHNTRGTGLANIWAAILAGSRRIDASVGGLGGCPFAPGAAGNVCSEDVLYMLERAGIATRVRLDAVMETSRWLETVMHKRMPGMVAHARPFPMAA